MSTHREVEIAGTSDDPECRVWVQAKGLAELRRCGFTTIHLRRLFYDSQFHESSNRFEVLADAFDAARRRWGPLWQGRI